MKRPDTKWTDLGGHEITLRDLGTCMPPRGCGWLWPEDASKPQLAHWHGDCYDCKASVVVSAAVCS